MARQAGRKPVRPVTRYTLAALLAVLLLLLFFLLLWELYDEGTSEKSWRIDTEDRSERK
jgi:hypothetical protein